MVRLIKCFFMFLMMTLASCSSEANDTKEVSPIVEIYRNLISSYDKNLSAGDFKGAYSSAKELLEIDPSDTTSYLKLVIAARELNMNLAELKSMYGAAAAEATEEEKALKSLANALVVAPN